MIDFGYTPKSGMHEFLELAVRRKCIFPAFKIRNGKVLILFNFLLKHGISFFYILSLSNWKKRLDGVKNIVVTANYLTIGVVKYLNEHHPNINVHVFYFNIVAKDVPPQYFKKLKCQLWSFDREDSNKYGMKHTITPICFENFDDLCMNNYLKEYDVFFLGVDKGRLQRLLEIKKEFLSENITCEYHIVDAFGTGEKNEYQYLDSISYSEYIEKAKKARALLEVKQSNQKGSTLRPIEAGFMKKKLITDDESIKDEPFYRENNVYILGEPRNLHEFIYEVAYDESFDYSQYDIEKWLKKF